MSERKVSGRSFAGRIVTVAVCAALLTACGDDPQAMLRSAKEYLAKGDTNAAAIQLKNALQKDGNLAEARFLLGQINLEQGDVAGAVKELRRAAQQNHPDAQVSPLLARALVQSGEFDEVLKAFDGKALEDPVGQAALLDAVGDAHFAKRNLEKARVSYEAALAASPSDVSARVSLGRAKLFGGDPDGALAEADRAVALKADAAEAHALRADVMMLRNQPAEVVTALEAAVAARPEAVNYHFALVSALLRENRFEEAVSRLEAMKKAAPRHPSTHYLQAVVELRNNRMAEARDHVAEAVRLAPDFLAARLLAGVVYGRLNQQVLVQEHLGVVLARAPKLILARRMFAASQLAAGEPSRALETLQPLLDAPSVDGATMALAGKIYTASGDLDRAAEYFAKVAAAEPKNAIARTRLGVSRLMGGDADRAVADLEAASELESDGGQADVALILVHLRRGEFDKAMRAQQQLEAKQPDNPQTHTLKGGILMGKKDVQGARAAFEKALELNPDYLAASANLARMDIADGRPDDARRRFEKIVAANPKNIEAHLSLANLLERTGAKPGEVLSALERAAAANPGAVGPRLAVTRHHLVAGEAKKALTVAQELAVAHPSDVQVIGLLAQAQLAAGDRQQAISSLNKLTGLLPQTPGPLIKLSDLQRVAKDHSGAERSLRRALEYKPDLLDAQQRLVSLFVEDKRMEEALAISKTIQRQRPKESVGLLFEGDIHMAGGNWTPAVQAYGKALQLAASPQAAVKLHAAQFKAGKAAEAAKTASDWVRTHPRDVMMRSYLAERALAEGRLDDARKLYEKLDELVPNNPSVMNNLAWIAGQRGDPAAIELARRALTLSPDNPAILDTLGMLQVEQGQRDEGLDNLRKAVSLAPEAGALRLNLAKAYLKAERKSEALKELEHLANQAPEGSPLRAQATSLKQGL